MAKGQMAHRGWGRKAGAGPEERESGAFAPLHQGGRFAGVGTREQGTKHHLGAKTQGKMGCGSRRRHFAPAAFGAALGEVGEEVVVTAWAVAAADAAGGTRRPGHHPDENRTGTHATGRQEDEVVKQQQRRARCLNVIALSQPGDVLVQARRLPCNAGREPVAVHLAPFRIREQFASIRAHDNEPVVPDSACRGDPSVAVRVKVRRECVRCCDRCPVPGRERIELGLDCLPVMAEFRDDPDAFRRLIEVRGHARERHGSTHVLEPVDEGPVPYAKVDAAHHQKVDKQHEQHPARDARGTFAIADSFEVFADDGLAVGGQQSRRFGSCVVDGRLLAHAMLR